MFKDRRRVKITLDNQEYTVTSQYSDEHVVTAATLLNEQLNDISRLAHSLSKEQRYLLTALNTLSKQIELEKEIFQLKKQVKQLQMHQMTQKSKNVSRHKKDGVSKQTTIEEFTSTFHAMVNEASHYQPALFNKKGE